MNPLFTEASFADISLMRAMTEAKAAPVSSLAPIISLDSKTAILAVLPRQDLGGEAVKHEQFGHWFFGCGVDRQRPQLEDEIAGGYSVSVTAAGRKKSKSAALIALASVNERSASKRAAVFGFAVAVVENAVEIVLNDLGLLDPVAAAIAH